MKKVLIFIIAALMVLSMAACGNQAPPSPTNDSSAETSAGSPAKSPEKTQQAAPQGALIEPEQLISQSDAETLTGAPFDKMEKTENDVVGLKMVQYITDDASNYMQVGITQQAFIKTDDLTVKFLYDGIKEAFPDAEAAAGVGEDAFFAAPGLHILYRGYYINIALSVTQKDNDKLIEVGKFACASLDKLLK